jgi:hypothetical protein
LEEAGKAANHPIAATIIIHNTIASIVLLACNAKNRKTSQLTTHRNATTTRAKIGVVYVLFAYAMCRDGAENSHSSFPLQVSLTCPFTISIASLVEDQKWKTLT